MSTIKYFLGCLVMSFMLLSCKKTVSYDIIGDPEVKFFTNNQAAGNAPQNSISYSVVNIPNTTGSGLVNLSSTIPASIKFPVYSTKPVSDVVTITATLDNSLIAKYNAANNTNYVAFPTSILNTTGLQARIDKGASTSSDSITITSNAASLNLLSGTAYMAPILLTTVSNPAIGSITTNTTTQLTYIVVNAEQRRIKYLATTADALGALLTNRAAWTAVYNPAPTTVGSIFDGSATTFNRWVASPVQVDVNMQATQNVTGLRLFTANTAANAPTRVDLYLSNDGISFDLIGTPLRANLTYATTYNYILFYKAIPAKYIRLILYYGTSTNTQNFRVVELDVYAN